MAVPFLDKDVYGRSTLENSSFIASSKNPDKSIRGKGFVARLSGSTIEFISMWKLMFFGKRVFRLSGGELSFGVEPAIPAYLLKEAGGKYTVSSTLLGKTKVIYEMSDKRDYYPGNYEVTEYTLRFADGKEVTEQGAVLGKDMALSIREGKACEIKAVLKSIS